MHQGAAMATTVAVAVFFRRRGQSLAARGTGRRLAGRRRFGGGQRGQRRRRIRDDQLLPGCSTDWWRSDWRCDGRPVHAVLHGDGTQRFALGHFVDHHRIGGGGEGMMIGSVVKIGSAEATSALPFRPTWPTVT